MSFPSLTDFIEGDGKATGPGSVIDREFPFIPLTSLHMPKPGPDFLRAAAALGDEPPLYEGTGKHKRVSQHGPGLSYLYRQALYDPDFAMDVVVKKTRVVREVPFVPGHLWGNDVADGPRPADVMIIGKHPGREEVNKGRNFIGPASKDLYDALDEVQLPHEVWSTWYLTNLCRHDRLDPASNGLAADWVTNCLPLLHEEMRLILPKYILCFGSEAGKALLGKTGAVGQMFGVAVDYEIPVIEGGKLARWHTAKMMVVTHPAAVFHNPEQYTNLRDGLSQFAQLVSGQYVGRVEDDIRHEDIYKERHLEAVVDDILADPNPASRIIAIDCEWHGERPGEDGAYLRTIQFSHKPKHAYNVVLRHQHGLMAFKPGPDAAIRHLRRLLKARPGYQPRIGGHFLRADLPWLLDAGLDLIEEFDVPEYRSLEEAAEASKWEGGWDTGAMAHAHQETAEFKLEMLAVRYTPVPRYDLKLQKWKEWWCKKHNKTAKNMEGYGECPDWILHPYGCYDADATRRLFDVYMGVGDEPGLLDRDRYQNNCRQAYIITQMASLGFLEMEMVGLDVDRARGDRLTTLFMEAKAKRLMDLQKELEWEKFNPNSANQCRELLFGVSFNGAVSGKRISPDHVKLFDFEPIKATGKGARPWQSIVDRGQEKEFNPSTDKEVLGILSYEDKDGTVGRLRDCRLIGQVLKGVLRPPKTDEFEQIEVEDGFMVYPGGLLSAVGHDGRVRTHFYPVETGRVSSSRPNLQNLCFWRDVEFLTREGWVRSDDFVKWIEDGQPAVEIMQVDPTTGEASFVIPEVTRSKTETIIHFSSKWTDLMVTPEHRCPLFTADGFEDVLAKDLPAGDRREGVFHRNSAKYVGGSRELWHDTCVLLVAASRYGKEDEDGNLRIEIPSKLAAHKRQDLIEAITLLSRMATREDKSSKAQRVFVIENNPGLTDLRSWTSGLRLGSWVLELKPASLETLATVLITWTSSKNAEFVHPDRDQQQWAQIVFALTERPTNLGRRVTHYSVSAGSKKAATAVRSLTKTVKKVPETDVFCVTVPTSYVLVRRNGRVSVSGNSKRREPEYKRMIGADLYTYPIRSMLRATPGSLLVEVDIKSAELAAMAWMSQDAQMIEDVRRNMLPDGHPDQIDIHATTAKGAFRLDCEPTKKGLKKIGKEHLRTGAKGVNFGVPYQIGSESISRRCREEGVLVSIKEADQLKDGYFMRYPDTEPYLEDCKLSASDPGWMCNAFMRFRRFAITDDRQRLKEQERQACNFPIQSLVADAVSIAIRNLVRYRNRHGSAKKTFRIVLQIHDALIFEVHPRNLEWLLEEVVPTCMCDQVEVWPRTLQGREIAIDEPYHFGVDRELFVNWGDEFTENAAQALSVPKAYWPKH